MFVIFYHGRNVCTSINTRVLLVTQKKKYILINAKNKRLITSLKKRNRDVTGLFSGVK